MDLVERDEANPHRHPWEISRAQSILSLIRNFPKHFRYADIGSGDEFFTRQLIRLSDQAVYAVESSDRKPSPVPGVIRGSDMSSIPSGSVDCAFLLDVLEHVKDEAELLEPVLKILKDHGTMVITVPAHQFLFSEHDVFLKHFRRYRRRQLVDVLSGFDLEMSECFYFYASLFFARLAQVAARRAGIGGGPQQGIGGWAFAENHLLTRALIAVLNADFIFGRFVSRLGLSWPGLSLCMVCRKKA